jgi:hypothetical protein
LSEKDKLIRVVLSRRQILILLVPIMVATFVVTFALISADTLGYWADAYTVAVIVTLLLFVVMEFQLKSQH